MYGDLPIRHPVETCFLKKREVRRLKAAANLAPADKVAIGHAQIRGRRAFPSGNGEGLGQGGMAAGGSHAGPHVHENASHWLLEHKLANNFAIARKDRKRISRAAVQDQLDALLAGVTPVLLHVVRQHGAVLSAREKAALGDIGLLGHEHARRARHRDVCATSQVARRFTDELTVGAPVLAKTRAVKTLTLLVGKEVAAAALELGLKGLVHGLLDHNRLLGAR